MWTLVSITVGSLIGLGLFIWRYDVQERKEFELTLTPDELARFREFCAVSPWHQFEAMIASERAYKRRHAAQLEAEHNAESIPLARAALNRTEPRAGFKTGFPPTARCSGFRGSAQ